MALAAAIIAPIGEELFFRGFALTAWPRDMPERTALIRSAVFFAVVHIPNIRASRTRQRMGQALLQFAVIFPLGLVLGWLFLRRGSWPPSRGMWPTTASCWDCCPVTGGWRRAESVVAERVVPKVHGQAGRKSQASAHPYGGSAFGSGRRGNRRAPSFGPGSTSPPLRSSPPDARGSHGTSARRRSIRELATTERPGNDWRSGRRGTVRRGAGQPRLGDRHSPRRGWPRRRCPTRWPVRARWRDLPSSGCCRAWDPRAQLSWRRRSSWAGARWIGPTDAG